MTEGILVNVVDVPGKFVAVRRDHYKFLVYVSPENPVAGNLTWQPGKGYYQTTQHEVDAFDAKWKADRVGWKNTSR